jgi:hypothetical protein
MAIRRIVEQGANVTVREARGRRVAVIGNLVVWG